MGEDCFSQSTGEEHGNGIRTAEGCTAPCDLLDANARAGWCNSPWCYVDACVCNAEVSQSEYFVGQSISYSYATCGSDDEFAATITCTDHCDVLGCLDHGAHVAKAVSDVCCMTLNPLQPDDMPSSDTDEDDHHTINHQY